MITIRLFLALSLVLAVASFSAGTGYRRVVASKQRISQRQLSMEYVPDGMSKAEWKKLQQKEKEATKDKTTGLSGSQSSRAALSRLGRSLEARTSSPSIPLCLSRRGRTCRGQVAVLMARI